MTSLTALAQAAHATAPAFNSNFYTTAAAVIPVLFLAIVFQNTTWQDMARAQRAAIRASGGGINRHTVIYYTLGILSAAILLLGVAGEIYAITSLYQQKASGYAPAAALTALIFLTAATAVIAWLPFIRTPRDGQPANPPQAKPGEPDPV